MPSQLQLWWQWLDSLIRTVQDAQKGGERARERDRWGKKPKSRPFFLEEMKSGKARASEAPGLPRDALPLLTAQRPQRKPRPRACAPGRPWLRGWVEWQLSCGLMAWHSSNTGTPCCRVRGWIQVGEGDGGSDGSVYVCPREHLYMPNATGRQHKGNTLWAGDNLPAEPHRCKTSRSPARAGGRGWARMCGRGRRECAKCTSASEIPLCRQLLREMQ